MAVRTRTRTLTRESPQFNGGSDRRVRVRVRVSLERQLERLVVHHRQRTGQARTDRAGVRVGGITEAGAAPAEHLGPRGQLHVDFQPDNDLVRWLAHFSR